MIAETSTSFNRLYTTLPESGDTPDINNATLPEYTETNLNNIVSSFLLPTETNPFNLNSFSIDQKLPNVHGFKSVWPDVLSVNTMSAWDVHVNTTSAQVNNTTWFGIEKEPIGNWTLLLLSPVALFGIGGNILAIMAISLERRLQNVTNYFLLSLAVTDLLVSLIVMPLSIINGFTGQWLFGIPLCDLFVTSDVLMCTSSILHLCTISLERYIGIRYPLWSKNKSKRIVFFKIILVWTIAIAISSPITILGVLDPDNILQDGQCVLNNEHFIVYGSTFAFFIPLLIMIVMYTLTVRMLNKQASLCNSNEDQKEGQPMIRRSTSRRQWRGRESYYHKDLSYSRSYPSSGTSTGFGENSNTCPRSMSHSYTPLKTRNTIPRSHRYNRRRPQSSEWQNDFSYRNGSTQDLTMQSPEKVSCCSMVHQKREPKRLRDLVKKHHVAIKAANLLLLKRDSIRKDNRVKTEQRASKVLGVVFLIFVICWAPFFVVNIMTVICKSCSFEPTLITAFIWLGYVSSTLNPIIYTIFNKVFRMTFIKLLCCRYSTLHTGHVRQNSNTVGSTTSRLVLRNGNSFCASGTSASIEDSVC